MDLPVVPNSDRTELVQSASYSRAPLSKGQECPVVFPEGLQFLAERCRETIGVRVKNVQDLDTSKLLPENFYKSLGNLLELVSSLQGSLNCNPQCQDFFLTALETGFGSLERMLLEKNEDKDLIHLRETIQDAKLFVSSRCPAVVMNWAPDLLSRVLDETELGIKSSQCHGDHCPLLIHQLRDVLESDLARRIFAAQNREGAIDRLSNRMASLNDNISLAGLALAGEAADKCRAIFSGPRCESIGLLVDTPDARFEAAFRLLIRVLPETQRDELCAADQMCRKRLELANRILDLIKAEHDWELWNTPDCLHYSVDQLNNFVASEGKGFGASRAGFADPLLSIRDDDIAFPWVKEINKIIASSGIEATVSDSSLENELIKASDRLRNRNERFMPEGEPLRILQYNPELAVTPPTAVIHDVCDLQAQWSLRNKRDDKTPVIEFPFSEEDLLQRIRRNNEVYIVAKLGGETIGAYLLFVNCERMPWSGQEIKRVLPDEKPKVIYADEVVRSRHVKYPGLYHLLDLSMESVARVHAYNRSAEIIGLVEPSNAGVMKAHNPLGWSTTDFQIVSPDGNTFDVVRRPLANLR